MVPSQWLAATQSKLPSRHLKNVSQRNVDRDTLGLAESSSSRSYHWHHQADLESRPPGRCQFSPERVKVFAESSVNRSYHWYHQADLESRLPGRCQFVSPGRVIVFTVARTVAGMLKFINVFTVARTVAIVFLEEYLNVRAVAPTAIIL